MADIGERRALASAAQLALFGHYPFITGALFREGPRDPWQRFILAADRSTGKRPICPLALHHRPLHLVNKTLFDREPLSDGAAAIYDSRRHELRPNDTT